MAELTQQVIDAVEGLRFPEDIKQEFYLRWLESPEPEAPFTSVHHITGFCTSYMNNMLKNQRKVDTNRKRIERENSDAIKAVFYEDNQAADPAEIVEAQATMSARLDQLSPLVRRTLEQYYVEGLTVEDIAALEWVDEEAIRKRITRGRNLLKGEVND